MQQTLDASGILQLPIAGRLFLLQDIGASAPLDVELLRGGTAALRLAGQGRGLRLWFINRFDGFRITGTPGAVIEFIIADEDVQIDTADGAAVTISNAIGNPVPVQLTGSAVTISNATAAPVPVLSNLAGVLTDAAPVAVSDVAAVLLAASATRRGFRVYNAGVNPVAIGGAAVAFANAAIILQAGDIWAESDAPGAAWKCICGAGLASTLNVLGQST